MKIAVHNHQENVHKLYDYASGEIVVLSEDEATQADVNANGHMIKDGESWTLEVIRPIFAPDSPVWRTAFVIGNATEAAALEKSKYILLGEMLSGSTAAIYQ